MWVARLVIEHHNTKSYYAKVIMGTHQDQDSLVLALPRCCCVSGSSCRQKGRRRRRGGERGREGCMIVLKYSLTTVNVKLDQKLIKMRA